MHCHEGKLFGRGRDSADGGQAASGAIASRCGDTFRQEPEIARLASPASRISPLATVRIVRSFVTVDQNQQVQKTAAARPGVFSRTGRG